MKKNVIVMRHAEARGGFADRLTEEGKRQLAAKNGAIGAALTEKTCPFGVSSPSFKGVETLLELGDETALIHLYTTRLLWGDPPDWAAIWSWLEELKNADQLIVVTHYPQLLRFPAFCRDQLGIDVPDLEPNQLWPACGIALNLIEKSFALI